MHIFPDNLSRNSWTDWKEKQRLPAVLGGCIEILVFETPVPKEKKEIG